jgi:uncharacterized protein YyaL (SSP411 family)
MAGRPNRLARESSPYLLLHADNPVDWYPWGEEAFEKARRENLPIFLSVGYSTCFWCHVMERGVFEAPEIAALMNQWFVNIKVDREERPDLDRLYMTATQILTGSGGWPNSVFLTPDLKPFFAGTYFPPQDSLGKPGFPAVLRRMHEIWAADEAGVRAHADSVLGAIERVMALAAGDTAPPPRETVDAVVAELEARYDERWGGFGGAPKFPSPSNLYLLMEAGRDGNAAAMGMARGTLAAMAAGGIRDHVGGGFHRYSTDAQWLVPHFEKMLSDNALLLDLYAAAAKDGADAVGAGGVALVPPSRGGAVDPAAVAREIAGFVAREMTSPDGAFYAALDAETSGEEGAFYAWTPAEVAEVLGSGRGGVFIRVYGLDGPAQMEGGRHVLRLARSADDVAREIGIPAGESARALDRDRERLLDARGRRPRPLTDTKVIAAWNGMMIAALARGGQALGEPAWIAAAERAAQFLDSRFKDGDGGLAHSWTAGTVKGPAYLDDYAFVIWGYISLASARTEGPWLDRARALAEEMLRNFGDPVAGGFFDAPGGDASLLVRSKEAHDGATPSGCSVAVLSLLDLTARTGEERYREEAARALAAYAPVLRDAPASAPMLAVALEEYHRTAPEVSPAGGSMEEESLKVVDVKIAAPAQALATGGIISVDVVLRVRDGWHVNANPASDEFLIPTEIALADSAAGVTLVRVDYPEAVKRRFAFSETPLAVYEGEVRIRVRLEAEASETRPLRGIALDVTYQPCDEERCLAPATRRVVLD